MALCYSSDADTDGSGAMFVLVKLMESPFHIATVSCVSVEAAEELVHVMSEVIRESVLGVSVTVKDVAVVELSR